MRWVETTTIPNLQGRGGCRMVGQGFSTCTACYRQGLGRKRAPPPTRKDEAQLLCMRVWNRQTVASSRPRRWRRGVALAQKTSRPPEGGKFRPFVPFLLKFDFAKSPLSQDSGSWISRYSAIQNLGDSMVKFTSSEKTGSISPSAISNPHARGRRNSFLVANPLISR